MWIHFFAHKKTLVYGGHFVFSLYTSTRLADSDLLGVCAVGGIPNYQFLKQHKLETSQTLKMRIFLPIFAHHYGQKGHILVV